MRPNFLFVGAMKCGTTSLASQMATHPDIFMSRQKELHFFSRDEVWQRGIGWYESQFADAVPAKAIGEASTTYTMYPTVAHVPQRVAQLLPDARFIYMIRHPIERIVSHYLHLWYDKIVSDPLEIEIERTPELLAYSQYDQQIKQFMPHFPLNRWLVIRTEEFADDPLTVNRQVYQFLGVDPAFRPADLTPRNVTVDKVRPSLPVRVLQSVPLLLPLARKLVPGGFRRKVAQTGGERADKPTMDDALHNRILEILRPNIAGLSEMLGRDFFALWNLRPR